MAFKIQKQVPIPSAVRDPDTIQRKYPYGRMDVGDFFFVPGKEKNTLSSHASAAGKKLSKKFITRLTWAVEDEDGDYVLANADAEGAVQGIGVWRIADDEPVEDEDAEDAAEDEE